MTHPIAILCTCSGVDEAERIAKALVEERLAACVNILPEIRSIYRWQGAIESSAEVLLVIKTVRERFDGLAARIRELHSYETPEIVALEIVVGDEKYVNWLREQV